MTARAVGPPLIAGALVLALQFVVGELVPRAGEPLVLRWARTAAEHPLRTGTALGLLLLAARRPIDGLRQGEGLRPGEALRPGDASGRDDPLRPGPDRRGADPVEKEGSSR